ncbi:amidase [SAR202 cluster bacterium AC-409-J13_OGT_754m]|nr:amidase [SAR202 cluster bacterium AC-409-J13_OGT_754m]
MNNLDICYASIEELATLIKNKELSPTEIVQCYLERIEATEPILNSFITVLNEQALSSAQTIEKEIYQGNYKGVFHGIPLGLKDIYYTKGIHTTSGIKIHKSFIPDYNSTVYTKLKNSGTILIGKLNLHPLALGGTGENSDFGNTYNPWNPQMLAGGSSSGSASAVASGQCTLAMGTDTGGSVRIPSSFCGLVGLKPTFGLVSRHGVGTLAPSMDHCGPLGRSVMDCALTLNVISGYDANDRSSYTGHVPNFTDTIKDGVKGIRIGVPKQFFEVPIDHEVKESVLRSIKMLEEMGAVIVDISWPSFHQILDIGSKLLSAEAATVHKNLLRRDGIRLPKDVRDRLENGLLITAADHMEFQEFRRQFNKESLELMETIDVIIGPTEPITAFTPETTEIKLDSHAIDPRVAVSTYTRIFNLNGFPAITLPCGFSRNKHPIGLQLAGKPYEDATILQVAHAYEEANDWNNRRPLL